VPVIRIVIVGDTQRILPIERVAFLRETNDAGRIAVGKAVLSEPSDVLVHLGDLVGAVGSAADWVRFDAIYAPGVLTAKHLRVCRGNHDCGGLLMGNPRVFNQRYPESLQTLQVRDVASCRLLLLDTNASHMTMAQWQAQRDAFATQLHLSDADPDVRSVVVFGHHSPFTNGRWHPPAPEVYEGFVGPFLQSKKTRLFFSGHVHGYERFLIEGRHFVVAGGGGGARFAHLHGKKQRQRAELDLPDPNPLHYVVVEIDDANFKCVTRGLTETGTFATIDEFSSLPGT